uniref:Uncharacterized protein n=1 Tax=Arundo donax TaxID=35708 RepID=A0A0A8YVY9_ARUDO
MTEAVLHQVFDPYGEVEHMEVSEGTSTVAAVVKYASLQEAEQALQMLNGRNVYDGCC